MKESQNVSNKETTELPIVFEKISELTAEEEKRLVPIKDARIIERIKGIVSPIIKESVEFGTVIKGKTVALPAGQLYQAVIPNGASLAKSKSMEGAFRGFFTSGKGIEGHANFIPVDGSKSPKIASPMNVTSIAMAVVSMVVGQYYMTQIDGNLKSLSDGIKKIIRDNRLKVKSQINVIAVAVSKFAAFKEENIADDGLRKEALSTLNAQEIECQKLLSYANDQLNEISNQQGLKFKQYEAKVHEASFWHGCQRILLEMLRLIDELIFVYNLGALSREQLYHSFHAFAIQSQESYERLKKWNEAECDSLCIYLESGDRERITEKNEKYWGPLYKLIEYSELNWGKIKPDTLTLMREQTAECYIPQLERVNMFEQDARIIIKDDEYYYLPSLPESE